MSYNFLAIVPGYAKYSFCSIEEVNFLLMVDGVICVMDKVFPSCAERFVLVFLYSHTGGHAGSLILAYLFFALTYRDVFKQL